MKNNIMTAGTDIPLAPGWHFAIGDEFTQPYMQSLRTFLQRERDDGHIVYPPDTEIFNALNLTPFEDIKIVILGQDPYHGEGQAHGLAFSVRPGVPLPPSLQNIYKELHTEYGPGARVHGDLTHWARQGVLLLNTSLTVRQSQPGSHQNKGWESLTDAIIRAVNDRHDHVVFMLWGAHAQKKGGVIDRNRHLVLTAPHPSPLSAYRGFLGCGHFKAANEYLAKHGRAPVEW